MRNGLKLKLISDIQMSTYMSDDTCIFILIATVTVEIDNRNANGIFYPITTHLDVANVKAIDPP